MEKIDKDKNSGSGAGWVLGAVFAGAAFIGGLLAYTQHEAAKEAVNKVPPYDRTGAKQPQKPS